MGEFSRLDGDASTRYLDEQIEQTQAMLRIGCHHNTQA